MIHLAFKSLSTPPRRKNLLAKFTIRMSVAKSCTPNTSGVLQAQTVKIYLNKNKMLVSSIKHNLLEF